MSDVAKIGSVMIRNRVETGQNLIKSGKKIVSKVARIGSEDAIIGSGGQSDRQKA